jgi:aminobenzoyl-glutamate utilization protein A
MLERADRVVEHAAGMYDVSVSSSLFGRTTTFTADARLVGDVTDAAAALDCVTDVVERRDLGGSEDASYLVRRVQAAGGEATYLGIGASNEHGHHTARFDFDERALTTGVDVVAATVRSL